MQKYEVVDLGRRSNVNSLNDKGLIVGEREDDQGVWTAFLHDLNSLKILPALPGGTYSYAHGLNEHGVAVGVSGLPQGEAGAVMWQGVQPLRLKTLGGRKSEARALNSKNVTVGLSETAHGDFHAFVHDGASVIDLGTLGGRRSEAYGINDNGLIVGRAQTTTGVSQAFLRHPDREMRSLFADYAGSTSTARALNNMDQIVGDYQSKRSSKRVAYVHNSGIVQELKSLTSNSSSGALAINEIGDIVGYVKIHEREDRTRAVLWSSGEVWDLESRVLAPSQWELFEACGINNRGQIIGLGYYQGDQHAFLLYPV